MLVYPLGQLIVDLFKAVKNDLTLLLRQVKGLVKLIGEERIPVKDCPQVGSSQKVGMKEKRISRRLEIRIDMRNVHDLTGSDKDQCPILVVIILSSVLQDTALSLL